MHVIFEGVLPLETKLMLNNFMEDGFLTVGKLNERVSNFVYGRGEAINKPPKPFQEAHFTGVGSKLHLSCMLQVSVHAASNLSVCSCTASQMWNFATLLPLVLGDLIPDDNSKWECFLVLLEIIKMCTAKVTSQRASDYVKALIGQHHTLFKSCYPGVSFTPKRCTSLDC